MKKCVFTVAFAFLTAACNAVPVESNYGQSPDLTQIRIKEQPGEKLEYIGKIGNDYDTALDSLRKLKVIPGAIIKVPIEVLFDYDDRLFFGIVFGDCAMYSDVLDTKGNYYLRTWYSMVDSNTDGLNVTDTLSGNMTRSNTFFDLSGRRLSVSSASPVPSVLPKGVYIKDGKKVAVSSAAK